MTLTPARGAHAPAHASVRFEQISATAWSPRRPPYACGLHDADEQAGVLCFAVDPDGDPASVFAQLAPICGDALQLRMVEDVMAMDPLPVVEDYGVDSPVRKVSAFGVHAEGADRELASDSPGRPPLCFEIVEFLATDRWLIVCSHRAPSSAGGRPPLTSDRSGWPALLAQATRSWATHDLSTGFELGMVLLRELTRSYAATSHALLRWMELWELGFYSGRRIEDETLVLLRGLGAEYGARLNAMDRSADCERGNWFVGADADGTPVARLSGYAHENVDDAIKATERLGDMLRSSQELIQSRATAEHLRLQQVQADRTEHLQRNIERVTSLFLVPSLVAAFFGANTALPGGNGVHAWRSFELMIAVMVVGAAAVWMWMGHMRRRANGELSDEVAGA